MKRLNRAVWSSIKAVRRRRRRRRRGKGKEGEERGGITTADHPHTSHYRLLISDQLNRIVFQTGLQRPEALHAPLPSPAKASQKHPKSIPGASQEHSKSMEKSVLKAS